MEPLPLVRTVLLICLNGGGYHGSYLVIRQVVALVNLMVKASADTVNYDLDMDKISDLIDSLCDMSKIVNGTSNTAR